MADRAAPDLPARMDDASRRQRRARGVGAVRPAARRYGADRDAALARAKEWSDRATQLEDHMRRQDLRIKELEAHAGSDSGSACPPVCRLSESDDDGSR